MPTKPTTLPTWNTSGSNRTTPSAGKQASGHLVNEAPSSGEHNWIFFNGYKWDEWVSLGTSSPDEDAHIVETDGNGVARFAQGVFSGLSAGTSYGSAPLVAIATVLNSNGGNLTGLGTGNGVSGTGGNDGSGVVGACGTNGAAGQAGVLGTGIGSRPGVAGTGGATGAGVHGTGGATGGVGVQGDGTNISPGVLGTGSGTSSLSAGVVGASNHNDGAGVAGTTPGTATANGRGVQGTGTGDATGVVGLATNGYGVVAQSDTTTPARAALRIVPQDADPTTPAEGDVAYRSTTDEIRAYIESQWQTLIARPKGYTKAVSSVQSASNNSSAVYTTLVLLSLTGAAAPKQPGTIYIEASAEFGAAGATLHTLIDLRLRDTTSGVTIWSQSIDHPAAVAGPIHDRPWSIKVPYTLPAAGARNIELQFKINSGAGSGVQARDASMHIHGVY